MQNILVAIDGTESCGKAAQKAQELALLCQSNVTFVTVINKEALKADETWYELSKYIEDDQEEEGEEILYNCDLIYKRCKSNLEDSNLKTKRVVLNGENPAEVICSYSEENEFDLIVLADKEKSRVKRFFLGSTTEKVVRHASTSVLIVK